MPHCQVYGCADPDGWPRTTSDFVCADCARAGQVALSGLLRGYAALHPALLKAHRSNAERVRLPAPDSKPPLRVAVYDLIGQVHAVILAWERWTRRELHLPTPERTGLPGRRFQAAVDRLDASWPQLMRMAAGSQLVDAVAELRDRAFAMLRWDELVHELPLPCPRCDRIALLRANGTEAVFCGTCRYRLSGREYRDAVRGAVADLVQR